jgi:hypothetical protein
VPDQPRNLERSLLAVKIYPADNPHQTLQLVDIKKILITTQKMS